jgi:hypothetical protein
MVCGQSMEPVPDLAQEIAASLEDKQEWNRHTKSAKQAKLVQGLLKGLKLVRLGGGKGRALAAEVRSWHHNTVYVCRPKAAFVWKAKPQPLFPTGWGELERSDGAAAGGGEPAGGREGGGRGPQPGD